VLTLRGDRAARRRVREPRLGVDKVRITGGEPLLRRELAELVRMLAAKPALRDLAMTTNGVLLGRARRGAARAGLQARHGQPRHAATRRRSARCAARRSRPRARRHRAARAPASRRSSSTPS
jgi:hypothetical protein